MRANRSSFRRSNSILVAFISAMRGVSLRHPGPEGGLILDGGSLGLNQRSLS